MSLRLNSLILVTATVDQSASVMNTYRYKPYGELLAKTGTGSDPQFGWVGSQGYAGTGRKYAEVYVRARHYSSANARWTSKDPIGQGGGDLNFYRYVENRPTRWADPSGLALPCKSSHPDKNGPFCCIGQCPKDKQGNFICRGFEGRTFCDTTGHLSMVICPNYYANVSKKDVDKYIVPCTILHEQTHWDAEKPRCDKLQQCCNKSKPNCDKCRETYTKWFQQTAVSAECGPFRVSLRCIQAMQKKVCLGKRHDYFCDTVVPFLVKSFQELANKSCATKACPCPKHL